MPRCHNTVVAFAAVTCLLGVLNGEAVAQPLLGSVQQHSFTGPITGEQVNFNIYLPPNYAQNLGHYPVIYHLHGLGGSQGGPHNTSVPASFEQAMAANTLGPVIIVFANGYTDSFWADAFDGSKPADTDVIAQLIPHVDANFRTKRFAGARIVQGFSMGGFGATKFYCKYPDMFAACIEYDGAMVTWPIMQQFHSTLAASIFNNSETYFNQYSPWHWSSTNDAALLSKPPIRMVVGSLVGGNQNFRDHLQALSIPVDYVTTACGHELGCLLTAQGQASAAFIAAQWDLGDAEDLNGDGAINVIDLLRVITTWGPCPAPGSPGADCPADIDDSGSVNVLDLLAVIQAWG